MEFAFLVFACDWSLYMIVAFLSDTFLNDGDLLIEWIFAHASAVFWWLVFVTAHSECLAFSSVDQLDSTCSVMYGHEENMLSETMHCLK
jgi:hypothetical protein